MSDTDPKIIQVCFGVSPAMADLIVLFMTNRIVDADLMISAGADPNNYRMAIYRLRNALDSFGVQIQSQQFLGYWMEPEDRAKVRALIAATEKKLAPDSADAGTPAQNTA